MTCYRVKNGRHNDSTCTRPGQNSCNAVAPTGTVASHSVEVGESCAGLHLTGHRG